MRFVKACSRAKIRIFTLGAILVSAAIVLSLVNIININAAANDSKDIPVNETVERGGVAVTLEKLELTEKETQLTYSYDSTSGGHVDPLGLPRIDLPNGGKLEAERGNGAVDGATRSGTKKVKLPPIPEGTETISADLASFIRYTAESELVEIPLGDLLEGVDFEAIVERQELPLNVKFSVGPAQYRITSLLLDPSSFALVYEPLNQPASLTVLGAGISNVQLTDDQERTYFSFLTGAEWSQVDNSGHTVTQQGLYFEGLPDPDTTTFSLQFEGTGEIEAPYVFQVDIP